MTRRTEPTDEDIETARVALFSLTNRRYIVAKAIATARAQGIAEQQARLDAIACIMKEALARSGAGSRLVRVMTESEARAIEILATGLPRRECERLCRKYRTKEKKRDDRR